MSGNMRCEHILEMRYVGQAFELSVALPHDLDQLQYKQVFEAFRAAHHRVFEFSKPPEDPAEIVSYRVGVHAAVEAFPFTEVTPVATPESATQRTINVTENGKSASCTVLPRTCLLYTSPSPRDGLLSRMPSSA